MYKQYATEVRSHGRAASPPRTEDDFDELMDKSWLDRSSNKQPDTYHVAQEAPLAMVSTSNSYPRQALSLHDSQAYAQSSNLDIDGQLEQRIRYIEAETKQDMIDILRLQQF